MSTPPPSSQRTCPTCGRAVDTLRAGVVAILDGQFAYFCSTDCKRQSPALSITPPPVQPVRAARVPEPEPEPEP
ncbi:MAG: hypothetical protein ABI175_19065, partial [Polyangiales bacterium]